MIKIKFQTEWQKIAEKMMLEILLDNDCINRESCPKCGDDRRLIYNSQQHFKEISNASELFFTKNPELNNDEDIEEICIGGIEDGHRKYEKLEGFDILNKALDNYFESI